jgi:hypothetical protein
MALVFNMDAMCGYRDQVTGIAPDTFSVPITKDARGTYFNNYIASQIRFLGLPSFNFTKDFVLETLCYRPGNDARNGAWHAVLFENAGYNNGAIDSFDLTLRFDRGGGHEVTCLSSYKDATTSGFISLYTFPKIEPTHLIYHYDDTIKTIRLYANGTLRNTTVLSKPFKMPNVGYKKFLGYLGANAVAMMGKMYFVKMYDTPQDPKELYLNSRNRLLATNSQIFF